MVSGRVRSPVVKIRNARPLAAVFVLMMLAGCVQPGIKVRQVYLSGNRHVDDSTVLAGMNEKPDSPLPWRQAHRFDRRELETDREAVKSIMGANGYPNAKVTRAEAVTAGKDADEVNLYFDIVEGPPIVVSSVHIEGAPAGLGIDERMIDLAPGDVLVHARHTEAKERIRQYLIAHGYLRAQVTGTVLTTPEYRTAAITIVVQAGPLVHFGKTTIEGEASGPRDAIVERVAWQEGEVYDPELLALTERRLYALGRFSSVHFDPDPVEGTDPSVVDMNVHVAEAKSFELRLGVGFGTDPVHSEVRARGGVAKRGWPFAMTTLKLDGLVAPTFLFEQGTFLGYEYKLAARGEQEDFVVPRLRLGVELDYSQQVAEAYSLQGPRLRTSLERSFWRDRVSLGVGWQGRYQDVTEVSGAVSAAQQATLGLVGKYVDASYFQSLVLDLRDNPLETRSGFYAEARVQEGGAAAGGHFDYVKVTPEARGYVPVGRRVVIAARARLGLGFAQGGGALPITERYFAGGSSSQRGFAQQRLSPVATSADGFSVPIGGEALLETSLEGRFDLARWKRNLQLVLFLDGADVTSERAQLDPWHLHWAVGAGLRYQTPVGPLRFDVGYRLNRTGAGEPEPDTRFSFFLGLGEAF